MNREDTEALREGTDKMFMSSARADSQEGLPDFKQFQLVLRKRFSETYPVEHLPSEDVLEVLYNFGVDQISTRAFRMAVNSRLKSREGVWFLEWVKELHRHVKEVRYLLGRMESDDVYCDLVPPYYRQSMLTSAQALGPLLEIGDLLKEQYADLSHEFETEPVISASELLRRLRLGFDDILSRQCPVLSNNEKIELSSIAVELLGVKEEVSADTTGRHLRRLRKKTKLNPASRSAP